MAPNNNHNISFYYQNIRGTRTKCLDLFNNILSRNYDILMFTETWLQDDVFDTELCDGRYDVFRYDRDLLMSGKKSGGGVMLFCKRELRASIKAELICTPPDEYVCVTLSRQVLSASCDLHIVLTYIPSNIAELFPVRLQSIGEFVTRLVDLYPNDNYLLIGDLNLFCIQWRYSDYVLIHKGSVEVQNAAVDLIETLGYLDLKQYNNCLNYDGKTLDLCFCNLPLEVDQCDDPILRLDHYHPALNVNILDLHLIPLTERIEPKHNFIKGNYTEINDFLSSFDWPSLLSTGSLEEHVDVLYSKIYDSFKFIPKSIPKNKNYPIWFSPPLIKIIKEKTKVHAKWKKFKNNRDYDEFSLLRARQHRVQKQCFESFTARAEEGIRRTPKIFWKYVKSKRGSSNYPKQFTYENNSYNGGDQICEAFNNFFEKMFSHPTDPPNEDDKDTTNCYNTGISSIVIKQDSVFHLLHTLDKTKGSGCDGLSPIYLSNCAKSLSLPLTIIYNESLRLGIFPSLWKKAFITPIHKKGSKSVIENYRPISKLNIISKIFEKIVYNHIYPVITASISDRQHGFLRGRSTTTNLACYTDYVLNNMEGGGQVDVVYTDFEKAFDRVDHVILLGKLQTLGIHGDLLRWVSSYLTNRSQAVVLGGYRSDFAHVPSGVPQGSHVGPLFYNAYIYDIYKAIENSQHLLYADDKKIFLRVRSVTDCDMLQRDLNSLQEYYNSNRITVSVGKCQCISFTRKTNPVIYPYNFNGTEIERVNVVKDLGIYFDSKMLLSHHVDTIALRAYRSLGFVMRVCKAFRSAHSIKIVYYAYVRSLLEYASTIWSPSYKIHSDKIEKIQRLFIRHLNFKLRINFDSYIKGCRNNRLLTLEERRTVADMALLFDVVRGRADCPQLLAGIGLWVPAHRTRHTANRCFNVPRHRTNYAQNSVLTRLPKTYNNRFSDVDIFMCSKTEFKNQIIDNILTNVN